MIGLSGCGVEVSGLTAPGAKLWVEINIPRNPVLIVQALTVASRKLINAPASSILVPSPQSGISKSLTPTLRV